MPPRDDGMSNGAGAAEDVASGLSGAVPPDVASDFAALAETVPGITTTNGGISALGLGAEQTQITMNGMSFPGADLPRAVEPTVRVATSSFDPARGWFGGAQVDAGLGIGPRFSRRSGYLTLDVPALQYTDPVSSRLGARPFRLQGSLGGSGPLDDDRYWYNYGLEGRRSITDASTLLDLDTELLQLAGVSADSAAKLLDLLAAAGIPTSAPGASSFASDNASVFATVSRAPYDWKTLTPSKRTAQLTVYGKLSRAQQVMAGPSLLTATPAHGGRSHEAIGNVQGLYSSYFGPHDWLNTSRSAFSISTSRSDPFLQLPSGQVLLSSSFPDGPGGVSSLTFGGNSALDESMTRWTWETINETKFYARGKPAHLVKLTVDARLDGYTQERAANRLGSFSFNSLDALADARPSSFTRTLALPEHRGGEWNGFIALGDQWRVSPKLQLQYGARLERNVFTSAPAYNPEVDRLLGRRTDHAPNTIHVSPRVGFTWVTGSPGGTAMFSQLGRFFGGPKGYVRGGIGEFRNMIDPTLLASAIAQTGLSGSAQQLTCIGPAAPSPDWSVYGDPATIPESCVDSASTTPPFVDMAPSVQLFSRSYTAPRSWRGNLAYSSSYKWLVYSVEGIYSLNLDQRGFADLNFSDEQRFVLPDEGRPMFVSPSSIDAVSGVVSSVEARRSAAFSRVMEARSDLRSISEQLTVSLSPDIGSVRGRYFSFAYTLGRNRTRARGFDGSTFNSPVSSSWARGPLDVRHAFKVQGGISTKGVTLTIFGQFASGHPFTPMVSSDVNGDGYANDRAFIFAPAAAAQRGDTVVASRMRSLLTSAPSAVRRCLEQQLGHGATPASCEGPWTAALNARLSVSGQRLHLGDRATVSLNLTNPLGGLDRLLHGSEHLRGWGTQASPDPTLYYVRGYDVTAERFRYEVNPRFGDTRPGRTVLRAPFRLTLDVRMDLGRPMGEQQLDKWLKPGRAGHKGIRLTAKELKERYRRNVPDPYKAILEETDSLLLTRDQVEELQKVQESYRQQMDTLWASLAAYLAELSDQYDASAVLKRQESTIDAAWELTRLDVRRTLPGLLNPVQLKLLPWPASMLYQAREQLKVRVFAG